MSRPLAVVTGASSGIGEAIALRLGRSGYDLLLVARREQLLTTLARKIATSNPGAAVTPFALDLGAQDAAERLVERAPNATVVINNAGFGKVGEALHVEDATYQQMITLNVSALTAITLAYARRMVARGGGTIMNVGSTSAFQPIPYQAVYAATKAYVKSFTEALAYELKGKGVSVLAFHPGPTKTPFVDIAGAESQERTFGRFFMSVDEVADLAMKQIQSGEETVVAGALNEVAATLSSVGPSKLVREVSARLFKPR
jgi:short-subunit dehydrogenase